MNLGAKLLVGVGVAGAMLLAHGDADARGRHSREYASLVLGWEDGKVEWGFCTDKRTAYEASSCATQSFYGNGGHSTAKTWTWSCKGYWAVAVSRSGKTAGKANCRDSLSEAQAAADYACESSAGRGRCRPVKSGSDNI